MELIITEKPSVAKTIAEVLGITGKMDGYMEGGGYIISWCVGHLIELKEPEEYDSKYKKWGYETLPIIPDPFEYRVKKDTKKQFHIIKQLMHRKDVSCVIEATDAGREGELIFRLAYLMAGCEKPIKRLWISSMEECAIREGFNNLHPGSDYDNLYQAALCRQYADWLVGINGTRLFTTLYQSKVLKVGRVQTPTLAMLVDREAEILKFRSEPFYTVVVNIGGLEAVSERFKDKDKAESICASIHGKEAVIKDIVRSKKSINPPKLYDLTSLQRDANKIYGFSAKKTLDITQSLYEKKLVTYPRTDSNFLTEDMEDTAKELISIIKHHMPFINPFETDEIPDIRGVLNSKKVTDHHAIIPTKEIVNEKQSGISEDERKILYLLANRLLTATATKHKYEQIKAIVLIDDVEFSISANAVIDMGFKLQEEMLKDYLKSTYKGRFKPDEDNEEPKLDDPFDKNSTSEELKHLSKNQTVPIGDVQVKEGFTKPPQRYTESSLLSAMEHAGAKDMDRDVERKGLGTPATRADVIEKLVKDGYVKRDKKLMIPTEDGIKLITVLPDMVKSAALTANWENALIKVSRGEMTKNEFMEGIKEMVEEMVNTYEAVGEDNPFEGRKVLGKCPHCGADVYTGKFGPYCSDKCGMTFGKAMGATLTEDLVKELLNGNKIFLSGLKSKKGGTYSAYLEPDGVTDYSYTDRKGTTRTGYQYSFKMTFPERK